jgi:glutamate racemase
VIIVDSGLGGFSVVRALRATQPGLALTYIADTAGFPYGTKSEGDITARAKRVIGRALMLAPTSPVILACNTLSTLSLESLRLNFTVAFVGTVPAIKTAGQISKSKRFTLLATPNTATSQYSEALITQFANGCVVDCYGAPNLAAMIESMLLGNPFTDDALRAEIAPAFSSDQFGRTDCIVLGCTHYPLISAALERVAPWPVTFIDSSDAIARRALSLDDVPPVQSIAYVTNASDVERYRDVFVRADFADVRALTVS